MKKSKNNSILKTGVIGYEKITGAMIFGQYYKLNKNDKWKKSNMPMKEFMRICMTS